MKRGRGTRVWATRLAVLGGVTAAVAGVAFVLAGASGTAARAPASDPTSPVTRFVTAWHGHDYHAMYREITTAARARVPYTRFVAMYRHAADVATMRGLHATGRLRSGTGGVVTAPISVATRLFGRVRERMSVPVVSTPRGPRIAWTRALTFPGMLRGERLVRHARVPGGRGMILDRTGEVLAEGPATARTYPQGSAFAIVTGFVKAPEPVDVAGRVRAGWPAKLPYGQGGLEESLDSILAGSPRIALRAVSRATDRIRVLALRPGRSPRNVSTTLRVPVQQAAAAALGSRYGGVVVLSPTTGAVEADAGLGMDVLQPPGSSFKTITAAAALTAHKATLSTEYAYARYVLLDGWRLHNFHHESCGGSLIDAFAVSCNSVFAPLADEVGAQKLVAMADAFGFNRPAPIAYPVPESVTRKPSGMPSDLAVGVAGIGQGGVDATALQMASVAQTIGSGCVRRPPFLIRRPRRAREPHDAVQACAPAIAAEVTSMMEAVVRYGTGTSAAIAGVTVAGKTGTAEVGQHVRSDAWFIAFAPAEAPRVAVAVLVVKGGVGGDVAAPIARQVLEAALAQ